MNKKIRSIVNENLLYAFRENILIWPIIIFVLALVIFMNIWDAAIIWNFKNISYISVLSNVQYILWLVVIIYLSMSSFDKDIKTKNIYIILQQVTKKEYFLWKLISIFMLSWLINLIFLSIFMIWYIIYFKEINYELFYIFLFQQLEFLVISFIVALVSLLLVKNIWRILVISTFLIMWHMLSLIKDLIDRWILQLSWLLKWFVSIGYYVMPNLSAFNVKNTILLDTNLFNVFLNSAWYALVLIFLLYLISMRIFNKKDF